MGNPESLATVLSILTSSLKRARCGLSNPIKRLNRALTNFMRILRLDFETFSEAPINGADSVGLWNYVNHNSTQVLMAAYKLPGAKEVLLWQPHLGPMPEDLRAALLDPEVMVSAFNSTFERYVLQFRLGIKIPVDRFLDPQVGARYLSLPGDLEECSIILGLPKSLAKDDRGHDLIKLFSQPQPNKKKRGEVQTYYQANHETHPKEWQEFCEYCIQDVVAEEEVTRRETLLGALPLPPSERKLWEFDQKVNDRGMPVDREFVTKAYALATRSKQEALDRQNAITGLQNANSTDQLKPWAKERGYPFNTLRKETVESVLKDPDVVLTPECRAVLKARSEASSTSYQKLDAISRQLSPDDQLRGQFIFLGSPRCGRWAGNAVQLHNMARPGVLGKTDENPNGYDFEDMDVFREARQMVLNQDYDGINEKYKSVLLVIKSLIRSSFSTECLDNQRFNVCDLNAIETRVGAWVSGCTGLMDVFVPYTDKFGVYQPNGRDPYIDFAVKIYGIAYDMIYADYKGINGKERKNLAKRMRQIAKPGVLGAIYRMAGGQWGFATKGHKDHGDDCNAKELNAKGKAIGKTKCKCPMIHDKIKTGLWGYADGMGIEMSQEQANDVVRIFRNSYPEIPAMWSALEDAVMDVMKGTQTTRRVGPNGCIEIGKINILGPDGNILRSIMYIQLPSGRRLHYFDAAIESCLMPWKDREGNDVYRDALVYGGVNQTTKQWSRIQTHGGKIFENIVQAISRDILGEKLLMFEENELPVYGHVHDEGVCVVPHDPFSPTDDLMVKIMSRSVFWAPGLLLGAGGFMDTIYHK